MKSPEPKEVSVEPHDEPAESTQRQDESPNGPEFESLSILARVFAVVTRPQDVQGRANQEPMLGPLDYQKERWRRIKAHQDGDEVLALVK
ncbi:hypothetical protein GN244_ATG09868 [Phytophthora infestans]|uniref:Uncharacterized protein n=1 Tax=Phytophthora infestans TaxID=4787 RepID=A0A833SSJ0_PHYIN|nr:hypothetical protein GN244_ATG09868 [Phytophthora infestans]KAF4145310.1 hypothetical protein GN958_ATG05499 [Phytophthora infestans]